MADADEVALRRRDLEREFDDKQRELKVQHKRHADKLQSDRLDWEASRKGQLKDLADRTERVKRQEENHKRDLEALAQARRELEQAKQAAREAGEARVEAKVARSDVAQATHRLEQARDVAAWFAILALAGFALLAGLAWWQGARPTAGVAAVAFLVGLLLEWRRKLAVR